MGRRGPGSRALENAGANAGGADIEEGRRAPPAWADILVFGALSVSDLDGLFDCGLTPTISRSARARRQTAAAA